MSQSGSLPPRHRPPHGHHRGDPRHDDAHAARDAARRNYALVHKGRQVRVGPVVFWIISGTIVIMAAWTVATATYFAFRDDVLTRLVARQAEMQYAYEDRISELRVQVDRATSRQLLDQEQFEKKLDQLQKRQATLEQRTSALGSMPDAMVTGSIKPTARPATAPAESPAMPKPSVINDTVIFVAPPDREARLESRVTKVAALPSAAAPNSSGMTGILGRLQSQLDRVEGRQLEAMNALEERYDSKMRRMRGVFTDLGLDMAEIEKATPRAAMGGPFVPAKPPFDASAFDKQFFRINVARAEVDRLSRTLALVPYRKPVIGEIEFTSGFGIRSDPFLGRPAMHTGLDFRAAMGDPVRATANGKVVSAGWSGGYGRMVEIDHGNGLSTRYGHLSEISVKVGETIKIGQVVGAVGSTGRSTGPHLHYETRIDGEAVDPQKFLRAGVRLADGGA